MPSISSIVDSLRLDKPYIISVSEISKTSKSMTDLTLSKSRLSIGCCPGWKFDLKKSAKRLTCSCDDLTRFSHYGWKITVRVFRLYKLKK